MERVFLVDGEEIPNPFWAPSPSPAASKVEGDGAGGGAGELIDVGGVADGGSGGGGDGDAGSEDSDWTEWGFRRKILEDELLLHADDGDDALAPANPDDEGPVVSPDPAVEVIPAAPAAAPPAPVVQASEVADPVAYHAMLRRKLDEELAVVALWMASRGGGSGSNLVQNEDVNEISSSSSWYTGEDTEGETEKTGDMSATGPEAKRRNEESDHDLARCSSTSWKQARLMDMEDQLSDLKVRNNTLLSHLSQVVHERNNYANDCMVLRAKVETLQLKLKITEDNLVRVMSTTTVAQPIAAISSLPIPFTSYPLGNTAAFNVSVPIQNDPLSCFTTPATPHREIQNNSYIPHAAPVFQTGDLTTASHQLYPVASMGHVRRMMLSSEPSTGVSHPSRELPQ